MTHVVSVLYIVNVEEHRVARKVRSDTDVAAAANRSCITQSQTSCCTSGRDGRDGRDGNEGQVGVAGPPGSPGSPGPKGGMGPIQWCGLCKVGPIKLSIRIHYSVFWESSWKEVQSERRNHRLSLPP